MLKICAGCTINSERCNLDGWQDYERKIKRNQPWHDLIQRSKSQDYINACQTRECQGVNYFLYF